MVKWKKIKYFWCVSNWMLFTQNIEQLGSNTHLWRGNFSTSTRPFREKIKEQKSIKANRKDIENLKPLLSCNESNAKTVTVQLVKATPH